MLFSPIVIYFASWILYEMCFLVSKLGTTKVIASADYILAWHIWIFFKDVVCWFFFSQIIKPIDSLQCFPAKLLLLNIHHVYLFFQNICSLGSISSCNGSIYSANLDLYAWSNWFLFIVCMSLPWVNHQGIFFPESALLSFKDTSVSISASNL